MINICLISNLVHPPFKDEFIVVKVAPKLEINLNLHMLHKTLEYIYCKFS